MFHHILFNSAIIIAAIFVMLHPQASAEGIIDGFLLCSNSLIPSLFPFMVLSNLWLKSGYDRYVVRALEPVMTKVFHLPPAAVSALLLGSIGGFPIGAQTAVKLYDEGKISKQDAEHLLMFCSNAGPAFVFGILGHQLFRSTLIGLSLWLIQILSSMLIGTVLRPHQESHVLCSFRAGSTTPSSFAERLVSSVQDAGHTMINICFFILVFSVISSQLYALIPLSWRKSLIAHFIIGLTELTKGIAQLKGVSQQTAFILSSALLSWNGVCIHCQVLSCAARRDISFRKYFQGKLLHIIISVTASCIIAPFLPLSALCMYTPKHSNIPLIIFAAGCIIFAAVKTSSGKPGELRI